MVGYVTVYVNCSLLPDITTDLNSGSDKNKLQILLALILKRFVYGRKADNNIVRRHDKAGGTFFNFDMFNIHIRNCYEKWNKYIF